jgi:uncharacterized membrane protein (DUF2068 family)
MDFQKTDPSHHRGLTIVAVFEAFKGVVVLVAGFALLTFIHKDLQHVAEQIVKHLHLNPASRAPRVFAEVLERASDAQLWWLAFGAMCYSTLRFIEAYGLWKNRRWAEWFALISSGFFLPAEIYEMFRKFNSIKFGLFVINVGIVLYMIYALKSSRAGNAAAAMTLENGDEEGDILKFPEPGVSAEVRRRKGR